MIFFIRLPVENSKQSNLRKKVQVKKTAKVENKLIEK